MRKFIGLILVVSVSFTASAFLSDYDVGLKYKSELAELTPFDVAILPEVSPAFTRPASVTEIPVSKFASVKPSKAVIVYRRARDAL
jgi:hypothetical protein